MLCISQELNGSKEVSHTMTNVDCFDTTGFEKQVTEFLHGITEFNNLNANQNQE